MAAYNNNFKQKKLNVLDRAVKKNPKYAHVESTIDTGSSLTKYYKKIEEIKTNYRYQQNEIFKRMKITTFVQLILQVADIDSLEKTSRTDAYVDSYDVNNKILKETAALATLGDNVNHFEHSNSIIDTDRHSTLHGVIHGIGEQDMRHSRIKENAKLGVMSEDLPYLLLDLRDKDEYNDCHIITALSYPIAMLSRSINNETKELLAYKNQEGKIIVVYDEDEKVAPRAAATLVERGYDNIFMLSGGLKLSTKKFPEGLLTGASLERAGQTNLNNKKTELNYSNNSVRSYETSKKSFDREDLDKLSNYMDKLLLNDDSRSSISRSTNNTDRKSIYSSTSAMSKASSIHSQPWKPV